MDQQQFYVVLPSNAPTPGNTSSVFTVRLPETLHLDHQWSVALSSFTYCHSFPTIGAEKDQFIDIYFGTEHQRIRVHIGPLVITSTNELKDTINKAIVERLKDVITKGKQQSRRKRSSEAPVLSAADRQKLQAAKRAVAKAFQDAISARNYAQLHRNLAEMMETRVTQWKAQYPSIVDPKFSRTLELLQRIQRTADAIEKSVNKWKHLKLI